MEILIAFIVYLVAALPWLKIIQIKEYFFPSLWAHFDYPSSWSIFFKRSEIFLLGLWLLLAIAAWLGLNLTPAITNLWFLLLGILLIVLLFKRRPLLQSFHWTPKFLFINFLLLILLARIVQYSGLNLLTFVLLATKISQLPLVLFSTYLANALTAFYAIFLYARAGQKIEKYKQQGLEIIGITGSYGKSSTKEFLGQLLGAKYKVLRSPARLNAEIGLAQFVLKSNLDNVDYLILEMGARAVGEIETLSKIFEPKIVHLTGLAPQHIATFGSMAKIIKAKLEILPTAMLDGIVLLNGADTFLQEIYTEINVPRKYLYGTGGHFYSKDENYSLEGTDFTFVHPGGEIRLKTNLIAPLQVENLVGALAGCYLLGLKPDALAATIKHLELLPHSYQILKTENPLIIDDSYNVNLVGAIKGAKHFLSLPLEQKIIIFAGILELGPETPNYYRQLIDVFKKADQVFLTFVDFAEVFSESIATAESLTEEKFTKFYPSLSKDKAGILILGRVPSWVFTILAGQSNYL